MNGTPIMADAQSATPYQPAYNDPLAYFKTLPVIDRQHVSWLLSFGVPTSAMGSQPHSPLKFCFGTIEAGDFLPSDCGPRLIGIAVEDCSGVIDVVAWNPRTDALGSLTGAAFALGEHHIDNPATCAIGGWLSVWQSPLDWLRAGREGIVILDNTRASGRLRFVSILEARNYEHRNALRRLVKLPPGPKIIVAREGRVA